MFLSIIKGVQIFSVIWYINIQFTVWDTCLWQNEYKRGDNWSIYCITDLLVLIGVGRTVVTMFQSHTDFDNTISITDLDNTISITDIDNKI